MDEIQIQIERSSSSPPPPRRANPQVANPLLVGAITVVGIVAVVLWLGSTTPDQAMPVETTTPTTSTSSTTATTRPVAEEASEPEDAVVTSWNQWLGELDSPAKLDGLVGPGSLDFIVQDEDDRSHLVNVSTSGVTVSDLKCDNTRSPLVIAELPNYLILATARSSCVVPKDGSKAPELIDGAPLTYEFVPADNTSGWFCESKGTRTQVAFYRVGESVGEFIDVPRCPDMATPDEVLLEQVPVRYFTPSEGFYWQQPRRQTVGVGIRDSEGCVDPEVVAPYLLCRTVTGIDVVSLLSSELAATVPADRGIRVFTYASPGARYLMLLSSPSERKTTDAWKSEAGLLELSTGTVTGLDLYLNPFDNFRWLSENEIAVLTQDEPGCLDCPSQLTVINVATSARTVLGDLPGTDVRLLS